MRPGAFAVRSLSQRTSMPQDKEVHERFYTLWADSCASAKGRLESKIVGSTGLLSNQRSPLVRLSRLGRFTSWSHHGNMNHRTDYEIITGMDDNKFPTGKSGDLQDNYVIGEEGIDSESTHGSEEAALVSIHPDLSSQIPSFQRVDALRKSSTKLAEQHALTTAGVGFKGLENITGPTNKLAQQYASITAAVSFKGLDNIFGPTNKLAEQYASITAGVGLKGLDNIFGQTNKLAEQYASITAGASLKGLEALLGPSKKLTDQYAEFAWDLKIKDLAELVRPAKEMASLFASLKPLPSICGIESLFSCGDSIAKGTARSGSLAAMMASMTSLPSMISIGASLATLGATQAANHINWESIQSPNLLEAVGAAAQIIEEDRHANGSLSALMSRLNAATNGGALNEAESTTAAATVELSTAAQSRDVGQLSDAAKVYLFRLFWIISILCSYLALQNGVREELCFLQPKIIPSMTAGQMGKAIRAAACDVPLEMLKDYRFVRGESVRLRVAPSYKAEAMQIFLANGDLLEVLSTENRDWLHVKIVSQEGVEGWISRKYARQITH